MELQFSELEGPIRVLRLTGSLDVAGTGQIETNFAGYCALDGVRVLVDLSGVDYLASIGIRLLILNAKAVAARGGRMALAGPQAEVKRVLEISGIPAIIPTYADVPAAQAALLGG